MTTTEPAPSVRLAAPPTPLPPAWERAIANSIAEQLRRGWRAHDVKSTMHPTGAPRSPGYSSAATFPPQLPSTYLESREVYARGLVDPIPQLDVPWIAWHLTQLDLAEALNRALLITHARDVDTWLKRPRPTDPYLAKPNRHGKLTLRRNSDTTPPAVADSLLAAVKAATVWLPDPLDVNDLLSEPVDLEQIMAALSA